MFNKSSFALFSSWSLVYFITMMGCTPRVQMVTDNIRNVKIFTWNVSKLTYSAINNQERIFHFNLKKEGYRNDSLILHVVSHYNKMSKDYKNDAYLVWEGMNEAVVFSPIEEINYLEQRNVFHTTTNASLTVDQNSESIPAIRSSEVPSEVINTINTVSSSSSDTNIKISSEVLNKVQSERGIYLSTTILISILEASKMQKGLKLRIYDIENDFFDISFSSEDLYDLENFIRSKR